MASCRAGLRTLGDVEAKGGDARLAVGGELEAPAEGVGVEEAVGAGELGDDDAVVRHVGVAAAPQEQRMVQRLERHLRGLRCRVEALG